MSVLLIDKHEKFFKRCITAFPASVQSEDSNKLALIAFCLNGLSLIKRFDFSKKVIDEFTQEILDGFLIESSQFTSFRATSYFRRCGEDPDSSYDLPNLSATLFGLTNLLTLHYDFSKRLSRDKIMNFVSRCQIKSGSLKGSFVPTLRNSNGEFEPFGESDLRQCYMAACIRKILKYDELVPEQRIHDIDVSSLAEFVLSRIQYNGAFSSNWLDEGHLGFTFCGIACLKLLGHDFSNSSKNFNTTKSWLLHRQVDYPASVYAGLDYEYYEPKDVGAFNGRENKFGDTCYSWWCTGSLKLLSNDNLQLLDLDAAQEYLLKRTQNSIMGGFQKDGDSNPDPFHAFLALASLAMWDVGRATKQFDLDVVDELLVISGSSSAFLDTIRF